MRRIAVLLISIALMTAGCGRTTVSSGRTDGGSANPPGPGESDPDAPAAGSPAEPTAGIVKQILGTWEAVNTANPKDKPTRTWTFTRTRVTLKAGEGSTTIPYRIERNYLIFVAPSGGSDGTFRIKSITDKKMVLHFVGKPAKLPENEPPPQADKLDQEFVKR